MVGPEHYVCQSWHVAAKVILQPYYRRSRHVETEEEGPCHTGVPRSSEAEFLTAREEDEDSPTEHSPSLTSTMSDTLVDKQEAASISRTLLPDIKRRESPTEQFFTVAEEIQPSTRSSKSNLSQTFLVPNNDSVIEVSDAKHIKKKHFETSEYSTTLLGTEQPYNNGNGVEFDEALKKVDKFLAETEEYLAKQNTKPEEIQNAPKIPSVSSQSQTLKVEANTHDNHSKCKVRKAEMEVSLSMVVPEWMNSKTEESFTDDKTSLSETLLASEMVLPSKSEYTYKSKWFEKMKNKFEHVEPADVSNKSGRKGCSKDLTYDEIDDDTEPYLPAITRDNSVITECYQYPPTPRPVQKEKVDTKSRNHIEEHIYEEITPRDVTPSISKRKQKNKALKPKQDEVKKEEVPLRVKTRRTTSCMTGIVSCFPWWVARRVYWKQDKISEHRYKDVAKRNSKIRLRISSEPISI